MEAWQQIYKSVSVAAENDDETEEYDELRGRVKEEIFNTDRGPIETELTTALGDCMQDARVSRCVEGDVLLAFACKPCIAHVLTRKIYRLRGKLRSSVIYDEHQTRTSRV